MDDKDKIEAIHKHTALTWRGLAQKLGLSTVQTFADIRNGRYGISASLADKIVRTFPEINREWLMHDEGEMIVDSSKNDVAGLNVYFPGVELAMRNTNESMSEYPLGAILMLRKIATLEQLVPGTNYYFVTPGMSAVKRMQKGSSPECVALFSTNAATYPDGRQIYEPFEISMDDIRDVYEVLGYLVSNNPLA